jgi:hypothetical protein
MNSIVSQFGIVLAAVLLAGLSITAAIGPAVSAHAAIA